jgi:uncharacterized membrane protein YbhN (UPF0104 family)
LSLAAFAYLFSIVDARALSAAVRDIGARAWLTALLLCAASLNSGVLRWWLLFHAFGAPQVPRYRQLTGHYATGFFYNTYLPGGVSGDVVRGLATQQAFGPGSAGGFATVVVDRALGLSALLGLVAAATLLHPRLGLERFQTRALAVFVLGIGLVLGIASLGRLARLLPVPRVRAWLSRVPAPHAYGPIVLGWIISVLSQIALTFAGHVLLCEIHAPPSVFDSLAIVPIASAAAFLPFSVSGAGFRETVFVQLYAQVGVPPQASLAAALCLWAVQAFLAGLCGVYVLLRRR